MPLDPSQLVATAVAFLIASIVQSAVGFGMGMLAVPILLWAGMTLPDAVAVVIGGMAVQGATAVFALRREVPWRLSFVVTVGRSIGIVAGVMLLGLINMLDPTRVKQIIGAVLLVVVISQRFCKVQPRDRVGLLWSGAAILLSGVMAAAVGMGGPPLVLWAFAHRWSAMRIRALLLSVFLLTTPILVPVIAWKLGPQVFQAALVGLLGAPILLVGSFIGLRIGRRLSRPLLEKLALGLLGLLALSSLLAPYL